MDRGCGAPSGIRVALVVLDHFNRKFNKEVGPFTPEAIAVLESAHWAGNVRELQNLMERLVALKASGPLGPADLGPIGRGRGTAAAQSLPLPLREAREQFEREYFANLLQSAGGNVSEAARLSGIARQNLYGHMERLGLGAKD